MVNCVVVVLTVLIASTLCAPRPSVSKRYRDDYEYNERTDAFYKLHTESRRNRDLENVCKVEGASLLVPVNHEDIVQVHGMFKRYPELGPHVWVAEDGHEHESAEEPAIINLSASEEPDYTEIHLVEHGDGTMHFYPVAGDCSVLSRRGDIEKVNCFQELPFVCKVDAKDAPYDSHCDVFASDYHYNATVGSCYSIRRWVASWNEAYSECRNEGAHLVVLNSEAEMDAVFGLMRDTPRVEGGQHSWYYFAGFRANKPVENETAVYKTIFNQTLSEAGYAVWSPGEPNNLGNEYCGTLFWSDGKLNDANCDLLYAFICEKEVHT